MKQFFKDQVMKKNLSWIVDFQFVPHETISGNYLLTDAHLVCAVIFPDRDGL